MPNNREQKSKGIVRSRSRQTMEFQLSGRGGRHKAATDYRRAPKHRDRGFSDD